MVTFEELTKGSRLRGISPAGPVVVIEAPAEKPPVFGDALRRLSDRATYLYRDGARYWYGLKATVSRLAADRANPHFGDDDVDEEIAKRLDAWRSAAGSVAKVHTRPRSSSDVSGEDATRLVVLGPDHPHDPRQEASKARAFAEQNPLNRPAAPGVTATCSCSVPPTGSGSATSMDPCGRGWSGGRSPRTVRRSASRPSSFARSTRR